MDWLRGGGSSWDEQLRSKLNQAANSARRLAEQAELPQLGEQLRASVQSFTEPAAHSERSGEQADVHQHQHQQHHQSRSRGGFTAFPLQAEVQQLVSSAQSLAKETGAALATTADHVVVGGASVLGMAGTGGSPQGTDLAELGRSFESEAHALDASSSPLERATRTLHTWHTRLSPEIAGSDTAAAAFKALLQSQAMYILLKALSRTAVGRRILRAAAVAQVSTETTSPKSTKDDAVPEAKAGNYLLRVLCRVSSSSSALLQQLLTLLADVSEASELSAVDGISSSEDLRWVLQLLTSSLMHAKEIELGEINQLREVVDRAIADACAEPSSSSTSSGESKTLEADGDLPAPGSEVWASWPGDGRWFRARIKGVSRGPGRRVEVAWLRPPSGEGGPSDAEYLAASGGDDTLFLQVGMQAVVPISQPRPCISSSIPGTSEECWAQQLETIEASSRSFRELRSLIATLENVASSSGIAGEDAALDANASILESLRTEGELRISQLGRAAVECCDTGKGCEEQLNTSHQSFESELATLREQKEIHLSREAELMREREELCAKLKAIDEQLSAVQATRQETEERERQVKAAEKRVESELQRELSKGTETGQSLASWQRVLTEASAASRDVEELLASRASSVRAAVAAQEALAARCPAVAAMCLKSENSRAKSLEELLAWWHSAIWGPGAEALIRDASKVAALRALHLRAGNIVEHAWREAVQLAAEELGGGSLGADSEGMSRSAEKYKRMRQQLQGNLERLAKLELTAPQASKATSVIHEEGLPPKLTQEPAEQLVLEDSATQVKSDPNMLEKGSEERESAPTLAPREPAVTKTTEATIGTVNPVDVALPTESDPKDKQVLPATSSTGDADEEDAE